MSMMDGSMMMTMPMGIGMLLACLLVLAVFLIVAAAAIKYLFFDGGRRDGSPNATRHDAGPGAT